MKIETAHEHALNCDLRTLVLKSSEDWYELERSGKKPNTVRWMGETEWMNSVDEGIDYVRICHVDDPNGTMFTRAVTWSGVIGRLLGKRLVMICWRS